MTEVERGFHVSPAPKIVNEKRSSRVASVIVRNEEVYGHENNVYGFVLTRSVGQS